MNRMRPRGAMFAGHAQQFTQRLGLFERLAEQVEERLFSEVDAWRSRKIRAKMGAVSMSDREYIGILEKKIPALMKERADDAEALGKFIESFKYPDGYPWPPPPSDRAKHGAYTGAKNMIAGLSWYIADCIRARDRHYEEQARLSNIMHKSGRSHCKPGERTLDAVARIAADIERLEMFLIDKFGSIRAGANVVDLAIEEMKK